MLQIPYPKYHTLNTIGGRGYGIWGTVFGETVFRGSVFGVKVLGLGANGIWGRGIGVRYLGRRIGGLVFGRDIGGMVLGVRYLIRQETHFYFLTIIDDAHQIFLLMYIVDNRQKIKCVS